MAHVSVLELMHVNIEVTDVPRALAFYERLGLERIDRIGTPGRPGGWFRFGDGRELHISLGEAPIRSRAHFAIRVADLESARAALIAANAPIESERDIPGIERFFTRDPDGNRIELVATARSTDRGSGPNPIDVF